ncbi:MAG TPA: hypothetical protein VMS38_08740, partial [Pseudorhodoferax sp.]|nr:hypothetical protein [Pseudorhodoferax sp.]
MSTTASMSVPPSVLIEDGPYVVTHVEWGEPPQLAVRKALRPTRQGSAGLRNEARILELLRGIEGV